jgi:long-subunit fatty acid transport protein
MQRGRKMKNGSGSLSTFKAAIAAAITILFPSLLFAGAVPYYYKNILVGDRAATMGSAYTAVADDASGTFYNPAGTVYATGDSVSGSANVYHIQNATYQAAIGGNDWNRSSTTLIPNFFGLVKKLSKYTAGFSFVVPDSFVEHQDQQFTKLGRADLTQYVLNLHSEDITYLFGPSLAFKFSDKFSMGLTLYYSYRKYRMQESQVVEFTNGTALWTFNNASQTENGLLPKLGLMWSPVKPLSIGLTISRTFLFSSRIENQTNEKSLPNASTGLDPGVKVTIPEASTYKQKMPTQISLGVAYFPSPFLLLSTDIDCYTKADFRRMLINYSIGAEYYINESNAVRLGYFTNLSNQNDITPAEASMSEKVNMYGFSTGYSLFGKSSSLTLGLIYSRGSGLSQPYGDTTIVKLTRYNLTTLIAASYGL